MNEPMIAIIGGQLVDGNGGPPIPNGGIVIQGKKIAAAGDMAGLHIPGNARRIDVAGKTILPGLIDAHMHFLGPRDSNQISWVMEPPYIRAMRCVMDAWKMIDSGFTTVRDMGGMFGIYLKQVISEGTVVGPRIVASGLAVTQTAGHADWHMVPKDWGERVMLGRLADGADEVRKAAREQLREGADCLKIMTTGGVLSEKDDPASMQFTREEIRAFVEVAKNAGVRTAAHAQGTRGIMNALQCGIDSIEHGMLLDDACIELMLKNGTHLVPTLSVVDAVVTRGRAAGIMESSVRKAESLQHQHLESFQKAYRAGITCGLGTDTLGEDMAPAGNSARELEIYVQQAGLTPMAAIVCATRSNAAVIGLEDQLGVLEPGKIADILIVNGDPLENISILKDRENIDAIYAGGKRVPRLNLSNGN